MDIQKTTTEIANDLNAEGAKLKADWEAFAAREAAFAKKLRSASSAVVMRLEDYVVRAERFAVKHPYLDTLYKIGGGFVVGFAVRWVFQ